MRIARSGDRILKKSPRLGLTKTHMFKLISKAYSQGLSLDWLCFYGGVGRSGYYRWHRNKDNKMTRDAESVALIRDIAGHHNHKFGVRRICMNLLTIGIVMNPKKIKRIKLEYGIPTKVRKKNPYNIAFKKDQEHRTASNLLNRKFKQVKVPGAVFCTDITYLYYDGGVAYLSGTKDIGSKEIVAHNLNGNMGIGTGMESIAGMLSSRPELRGSMIHSDQGVHYTHPLFVNLLSEYNITQSMSRKGDALDNAPIESFWGHLKDEVDYKKCKSLAELRGLIDNYVNYYNTERCQWNLKKMPPSKYREHLLRTAA